MTKKYKTYSEEFKRDALRLLETSAKTQAQIEQDLAVLDGLGVEIRYGREAGVEAVLDYTRTKTTWINTSEDPMANPFVMR